MILPYPRPIVTALFTRLFGSGLSEDDFSSVNLANEAVDLAFLVGTFLDDIFFLADLVFLESSYSSISSESGSLGGRIMGMQTIRKS